MLLALSYVHIQWFMYGMHAKQRAEYVIESIAKPSPEVTVLHQAIRLTQRGCMACLNLLNRHQQRSPQCLAADNQQHAVM